MGVEPTKTGRIGLEGVSGRRSGSNHRRSLFHCSIDLRRKKQTVPVDHFRTGGKVVYLDGLLLSLAHVKKRAGDLSVVSNRADTVFGRGLKNVWGDLKRDVRSGRRSGCCAQEDGPR